MKTFDDFMLYMNDSGKFNDIYKKYAPDFESCGRINLTSEEGLSTIINIVQNSTLKVSLEYLREYHNWINED